VQPGFIFSIIHTSLIVHINILFTPILADKKALIKASQRYILTTKKDTKANSIFISSKNKNRLKFSGGVDSYVGAEKPAGRQD
jgi:hypothetical protein